MSRVDRKKPNDVCIELGLIRCRNEPRTACGADQSEWGTCDRLARRWPAKPRCVDWRTRARRERKREGRKLISPTPIALVRCFAAVDVGKQKSGGNDN